ncbi:hypothetical protein [Nostoc sp. ChiVER01]|uniref:hypothetical protein n=1 Tax=Nostoc sp. ChiVER01 TaxID=3075382 RepID=UPI002AD4F207|nr:hypothetical protein [Nostoc sp. ChiVER01]MDZ8226494.1 hypothetical protein [Nostoc sp. ChiVER01]
MIVPELEQQLLQLSPDDKLYIIQLLAQSLTTYKNNTQPVQTSKISEYPLPQFYGCIQDETFFRHPQGQQPEREPIL